MSHFIAANTNGRYTYSADKTRCAATTSDPVTVATPETTFTHNDGSSDVTLKFTSAVSTGIITVTKSGTYQGNTAGIATNADICGQACDNIPGCNFVSVTGLNLGSMVCTALKGCTPETKVSYTAGDAVLAKFAKSDLPLGQAPHGYEVDSGLKCDGNNLISDVSNVDFSFGTTTGIKVATTSGVMAFTGGTSSIPASDHLSFCAHACSAVATCNIVEALKDDSNVLKCVANDSCVGDDSGSGHSDHVLTKGDVVPVTANKWYELSTAGKKCSNANGDKSTAVAKAAAINFDYNGVTYAVYLHTDGTMKLLKDSNDYDAAFAHATYSKVTHYGICAAACDALTDCKNFDTYQDSTDAATCTPYAQTCTLSSATTGTNIFTPRGMPTNAPTKEPTKIPSATPSSGPSSTPTAAPSSGPSNSPSLGPSNGPTKGPSPMPSAPTVAPSSGPSRGPAVPTDAPSGPTNNPSPRPSQPTENPTPKPTQPTPFPSRPTKMPVKKPTPAPTHPTPAPTRPTPAPTAPTPAPTVATAVESDVETTSASSTIMALQVVVFLAWALF